MTDSSQLGQRATARPWEHPYDGDPAFPDLCIHCGVVGSYGHTAEYYWQQTEADLATALGLLRGASTRNHYSEQHEGMWPDCPDRNCDEDSAFLAQHPVRPDE